jgi:hypothetical protein
MRQQDRTMQTTMTTLSPAEVLSQAKQFFTRQTSIYTAYLDREGPTFVSLRGQGGEELIIGARTTADGTEVTGSTYLFDQQIARFFSTLPPFPGVVV